jgi:hypothetical protein
MAGVRWCNLLVIAGSARRPTTSRPAATIRATSPSGADLAVRRRWGSASRWRSRQARVGRDRRRGCFDGVGLARHHRRQTAEEPRDREAPRALDGMGRWRIKFCLTASTCSPTVRPQISPEAFSRTSCKTTGSAPRCRVRPSVMQDHSCCGFRITPQICYNIGQSRIPRREWRNKKRSSPGLHRTDRSSNSTSFKKRGARSVRCHAAATGITL